MKLRFENHCATLNATEPSLVQLVTPVKEVRKRPNFFPIWLLCIEPIADIMNHLVLSCELHKVELNTLMFMLLKMKTGAVLTHA